MSSNLVLIPEDRVHQLLDWESVNEAVEAALVSVSKKRAIQTPRTFTNILGSQDILLCMPGYLQKDDTGILACKMVTAFGNNDKRDPKLPTILANIFLFDETTGQLKSIIEAIQITAWRTASASVIATKYLHFSQPNRKNNILAILGAGTQGRIHAIAIHHAFKFKEIRIWNHRPQKASKLVEELKILGLPVKAFESAKDCVKDADVIVTATFATSFIIQLDWIKNNAHINAVGAGTNHHSELSPDIYQNCLIYVDHMDSAKVELKGIFDMKAKILGEIGEVIVGTQPKPDSSKVTVFHSLGIAAEDAAVGKLVYDRFISKQKNE